MYRKVKKPFWIIIIFEYFEKVIKKIFYTIYAGLIRKKNSEKSSKIKAKNAEHLLQNYDHI